MHPHRHSEHKHGLPAQRAVPVVDPRVILEDRGWFPRAAGRPKAMRIGSRSEIGRVEATQNLYRLNGPARCTLRVSRRRQHGDMSSESSYLDDVIIRGRSRASDVPDVHPRPEQLLQKGVLSVSPVGSRHGLSADFVAASLRTRPDLAAGNNNNNTSRVPLIEVGCSLVLPEHSVGFGPLLSCTVGSDSGVVR